MPAVSPGVFASWRETKKQLSRKDVYALQGAGAERR